MRTEMTIRKKAKTRLLAMLLTLTMVLSLGFPMTSLAANSDVTVTGKSASDIQTELQGALDAASPGDTVTVTGNKTGEDTRLVLNIPEDVTLVWCAVSVGLSFDIDGGGTFEIAQFGSITVVGRNAVNVETGHVIVSGGEVKTTRTYADYGEWRAAILVRRGTVTVTDGKVSAFCNAAAVEIVDGDLIMSGGELSVTDDEAAIAQNGFSMGFCYTIRIRNYGTVAITGGRVIAEGVESDGDYLAMNFDKCGLAAYVAGTCTGGFCMYAYPAYGIIVEVDAPAVPNTYDGTITGLTRQAGGDINEAWWDTTGAVPYLHFDHNSWYDFSVPWALYTPSAPAAKPVRLAQTGELFETLSAAIAAAAGHGLSTYTLEVIGDVSEPGTVVISSDVTIIGAEGKHTVTFAQPPSGQSYKISVEGGGKLTLGDGTNTNLLTILQVVEVTDGEILVKDGVSLKTDGNAALLLSGAAATGTISGGRFEATGTSGVALSLQCGATLDEISGGTFTGRIDAVHLTDAGTKINKISGGAFYQTDTNVTLHGHAVFVQDNSQIGEISGGYFEATRSALVVIRGGHVGEISGGEFVTTTTGSNGSNGAPDTRNAAVWVEGENAPTGIGTISGGHFRGTNFGVLVIMKNAQASIDAITGGVFEGTVALQNDTGCVINEISGGQIIGAQGILNAGKIVEISGNAEIHGDTSYGIYNYLGATIEEISGGTITSEKSNGIANTGTIKLISGGSIIGWYSAINCAGMNKGRLEKITNGVFRGKNDTAIKLGYTVLLEPGLQALQGFGRYMGKDGVIFNDESLVTYPVNAQRNKTYFMSTATEPVTGITDTEFKYLTLYYIVTVNDSYANTTGAGAYFDGETVTVNAGSRIDYTFTGWTTDDGVVFADAGDATTTFIMPEKNVTVTANWRYDGGGLFPSSTPESVTLEAEKTVTGPGATLTDGQFGFAVYENGAQVATGKNDADGKIVFSPISYTQAGTHTYIIKETSEDKSGWTTDKSEYTVTVTVTSNKGVLTATAAYQGGKPPVFNNQYKPGSATLELSKVLVDGNGNPIESGREFTVRLYDAFDKLLGTYTLKANGDAVTIPNLPANTSYILREDAVYGYKAVGYAASVNGHDGKSVSGPAARLNIPALYQNETIAVVVTNTPGTATPGGGDIPEINIDDDEAPLSPFIYDHVAYVIGYPDGTVRPGKSVTRAEVATVFFRLLTDEVRDANWTRLNPFTDVNGGNWYNNAVSVMSAMGIVNGYPNGTFRPDGAITRAELAAIAARFAEAMGMTPTNDVSFGDINGHWAENDITYAAAIGWVTGYPDGTYRPDKPITRAEFMTLVNRMLERVPEDEADLLPDEMTVWSDNADTTAWYYLAVQEATNSHVPEYKDETVPGLGFTYESWQEMLENPDWALLERD